MLSSRFRSLILALLICCFKFVQVAQARPAFADYTTPPSGQVTVPAEGGLTFQMKVNGQGPFATVFDTGAVNVISATFATQLGLKVEDNPIDFGAIGGGIKVQGGSVRTFRKRLHRWVSAYPLPEDQAG